MNGPADSDRSSSSSPLRHFAGDSVGYSIQDIYPDGVIVVSGSPVRSSSNHPSFMSQYAVTEDSSHPSDSVSSAVVNYGKCL